MANGFVADEVIDFTSEEGVFRVEAHRENKALWGEFMELVWRTLETEAIYVDLDLELARSGAGVVTVLVKGERGQSKAREILDRFRPMAIRHYASLSIDGFVEHSQMASSVQNEGAAA